MHIKHLGYFLLACVAMGCVQTSLPKPKGLLSLNYPDPSYQSFRNKAPFGFEYNQTARIKRSARQGHSLVYPDMKATLYLSYVPVTNNLDSLLTDAYKLPSKHISKAV